MRRVCYGVLVFLLIAPVLDYCYFFLFVLWIGEDEAIEREK